MTTSGRRQTTLADIAARAGTTVPTVSKVLNGRSDVSEATRARVMELVAATGYRRRRPLPASRPTGDRRLVDLVIPGVSGGWAGQVLVGVESAATRAGLDVVVTIAQPGADWVTRLLARSSSGAVLALVAADREQLATLAAAGIPVVLLDPVEPPPADVPSVGATNWPAGREVAEHLLGLGHRRLGVLGWRSDQLHSQARVDGFTSTVRMTDVGAEVDVVFTDGRLSPEEAAARLLDAPQPPTAIFACSDRLALAVLETAAALGISIPEQLSLVGFDDLPEAQWAGLTTVRQPIAEMGAAAFRLLLQLRDGPNTPPREELATSLVLRTTTGPAATPPTAGV